MITGEVEVFVQVVETRNILSSMCCSRIHENLKKAKAL
jgi:hypothetical protein